MTSAGTRNRSVSANYHVAKLSRGTALSSIDLPVEDNSGSNTLRDQHQNEISRVTNLRPAKPELSEGNRISVVINGHRQTHR